jgi:hypothetical protein
LSRFKRRSKGRPSTAIIKQPSGFADRTVVKLDYSNRYAFTNTAGITSAIVFNGNSIYDPDHTTGVGAGSAFGFTEWSAIYGKYRVHGSSIKVIAAYSGSSTMPVWVGLLPHSAYSTPTTVEPFSELPYSQNAMITPNSRPANLKSYMSTSKLFGIPRATFLGDSRYEGTNSADPAIPWAWTLATRPMDITTATVTYIWVKIRYYVELYDRFDLSS